jgi:chromosome segregation protein
MINRLVDAKPEEMRVFIEEAAGVSRYQARRRETLLHLDHTTQNLSRLEDIASELRSQLKTLKRQAETAIQYKTLESQIRTIKVEVLSFQCEQSSRLQQEYTLHMNDLGEQFKLVRSELTTLEHDLTSTSELFQRLIQQSTPLQSEWQQAEKKLAELKMTLEQKQTLFQQNTTALAQLEQQKAQTKERMQLIELQLESLHEQNELHTEQLQQQESQNQQQSQGLTDLKAQQQQLLQQFEQVKSLVEKQQQQKTQMLAQSEQLAKNILRFEQQKQVLEQQAAQIQNQSQLDAIDEQTDAINRQIKLQQDALDYFREQIDIANGVYDATLSVEGALRAMAAALGLETGTTKPIGANDKPGGGSGGGAVFGPGPAAPQAPARYSRMIYGGTAGVGHEELESSRPFQRRIVFRIEEGPKVKIPKSVRIF